MQRTIGAGSLERRREELGNVELLEDAGKPPKHRPAFPWRGGDGGDWGARGTLKPPFYLSPTRFWLCITDVGHLHSSRKGVETQLGSQDHIGLRGGAGSWGGL